MNSPEMEVRPDCYMIGARNPDAILQCNTYLRIFRGRRPIRYCVDPGSRRDRATVEENIRRLVDGPGGIHLMSLNHQDPDVVGNAPWLSEANPRITVLVSGDTWRLLRHWDFNPHRLSFAEQIPDGLAKLPGGPRLLIVPTPYCHFRGAIAFYDPEIRTLYSGDLFGGLNRPGEVRIFAEPSDWAASGSSTESTCPRKTPCNTPSGALTRCGPRLR